MLRLVHPLLAMLLYNAIATLKWEIGAFEENLKDETISALQETAFMSAPTSKGAAIRKQILVDHKRTTKKQNLPSSFL